jgi:hypothetical protein
MFGVIFGLDLVLRGRFGSGALLGAYVVIGGASYMMFTWLFNRPLLNDFLQTAGLRKALPAKQP